MDKSYLGGDTPESELWAVLDSTGKVLYTRGGSSTAPRLMVYPSLKKAESALSNSWIKQVIPDGSLVRVERIYTACGVQSE